MNVKEYYSSVYDNISENIATTILESLNSPINPYLSIEQSVLINNIVQVYALVENFAP